MFAVVLALLAFAFVVRFAIDMQRRVCIVDSVQDTVSTNQTLRDIPLVVTIGQDSTESYSLTAAFLQFLVRLFTCKGQFLKVSWRRDCKTYVGETRHVEKVVIGVFRAGINYANLSTVREAVENIGKTVGPLPWGKWLSFPYLKSHKGQIYVRLYPAVNGKVTSTYLIDGLPTELESLKDICLASEFQKREEPLACFDVKLASIVSFQETEETGS